MDQVNQFKNKIEFHEARFEAIAQTASDSIVISDENSIIVFANKKTYEIFGYAEGSLIGSDLGILMPEMYRQRHRAGVRRFIETGDTKLIGHVVEIEGLRKDGSILLLELSLSSWKEERRYFFSGIMRDITERKEIETHQVQLTKDLYSQNKDLQQFTYIVSHNLRSPVATAMGLIDLLAATDKNSEEFATSLDYLKGSINNMDTVLKDLNTILSIRDRKGAIYKEMVKLAPICQQVIEEQQESLKKCGGEVSLDIEEDTSVHTNKAYLYSIFYNLLSNAIKFRSPERVLKINIKCVSSKDKSIVISFSDNGSGFDMKLAGDKIFKLYKKFHSHSEGRGMGLYLVKTHLETMGGHIEVISQVNVGTKFLIYLK